MKEKVFPMTRGSLNTIYTGIKNCVIVNETFDKCGVSSDFIMLDKRKGVAVKDTFLGIDIMDSDVINGEDIHLGIDDDNVYIFNSLGEIIFEDEKHPFNPIKIVKGKGIGGHIVVDASTGGDLQISETNTNPGSEELDPYFIEGGPGLIALNVPNHGWTEATKRYITFTEGILKGAVNRILYSVGDTIYISGTNVYGSLPKPTDGYLVATESRENILVATKEGLKVINTIDRDPNYANKYVINPTFGEEDMFVISIDGNTILVSGSNLVEFEDDLSSQLQVGYNSVIEEGIVYVYKDDGSEILLEHKNSVLKTLDFNSEFKSASFVTSVEPNIGSNISIMIDGITINSSATTLSTFIIDIENNINMDNYSIERYNIGFFLREVNGNSINVVITEGTAYVHQKTDRNMSAFGESGREHVWFQINYGGHKKNYETKGYLHTGNTEHNKDDWSNGEDLHTFRKTDFLNSIINGLPNGYSGILKNNKVVAYKTNLSDNDISITDTSIIEMRIDTVINRSYYAQYGISVDGNYYTYNAANNTPEQLLDIARQYVINYGYTASSIEEHNNKLYCWVYKINKTDSSIDFFGKQASSIIRDSTGDDQHMKQGYWSKTESLNIDMSLRNSNLELSNPILLIEGDIYDVVNYNGIIMAMTSRAVFFSRNTFDDNVHFYPLDNIEYWNGFKLVPIGNSLAIFGKDGDNKIIRTGTTQLFGTDGVTTYKPYSLEYDEELYGKYSYITNRGTTYILNTDKQLIGLSVSQVSDNAFTVIETPVNSKFDQILQSIEGDVYMNNCGGNFNLLSINDGKTNNFVYDSINGVWSMNSFNFPVFKYCKKTGGGGILTGTNTEYPQGTISSIDGYTDMGEDYEQCVCFSMGDVHNFKEIAILRTVFGIVKGEVGLNVNLNINFEMDRGINQIFNKQLENYDLYDIIGSTNEEQQLIGYEDYKSNEGNICVPQTTIALSGRYMQFKYCSTERFILGKSYVLYEDQMVPYINPYSVSN